MTDGRVTMLGQSTTGACTSLPDGALDISAVVSGGTGDPIGELTVWMSDKRLAALEYAWWTD